MFFRVSTAAIEEKEKVPCSRKHWKELGLKRQVSYYYFSFISCFTSGLLRINMHGRGQWRIQRKEPTRNALDETIFLVGKKCNIAWKWKKLLLFSTFFACGGLLLHLLCPSISWSLLHLKTFFTQITQLLKNLSNKYVLQHIFCAIFLRGGGG